MKVIEFRLYMPTTPEQYQRCQLYLVAKASLEKEGADGIQIVVNEQYHENEVTGQYTHKKISLASKIPSWISSIFDSRLIIVNEHSWNAFPKLKTQYSSEMLPKLAVSVESFHESGIGTNENALNLSKSLLDIRKVIEIDVVNDIAASKDSSFDQDFSTFRSHKAQIGPLNNNWLKTTSPIMTCYKLFIIDIPYFALFSKQIENWVAKSLQEQLLLYHRKAIFWMDEWFDLSMQEIRNMEEIVKEKLDMMWKTDQSSSESDFPSPSPPINSKEEKEPIDLMKDLFNFNNESSTAESINLLEHQKVTCDSKSNLPPPEPVENSQETTFEDSNIENINMDLTSRPSETSNLQPSLHSDDIHLKASRIVPNRVGYIYKLGDGIWNNTWNKRYMIISSSQMWYYNDPREFKAKDTFSLFGAKISWCGELRFRSHSFQVIPNGKKAIFLSGENEFESLLWMEVFKTASLYSENLFPETLLMQESSPQGPTDTVNAQQKAPLNIDSKLNVILATEAPLYSTQKTTSKLKFEAESPESGSDSSIIPDSSEEDSSSFKHCIDELTKALNQNDYTPVYNENGLRISSKNKQSWNIINSYNDELSPGYHKYSKELNLFNLIYNILVYISITFLSIASIFQLGSLLFLIFYYSYNTFLSIVISLFTWNLPYFSYNIFTTLTFELIKLSFLIIFLIWLIFKAYNDSIKIESNIWDSHEMHTDTNPKIKASCVLPLSPSEIFNYLINSDNSGWPLSNLSFHKIPSSNSHSQHIHEVFIPLPIHYNINFVYFLAKCIISPREIFKRRWWKEFKDGSYLIVESNSSYSKKILTKDCTTTLSQETNLVEKAKHSKLNLAGSLKQNISNINYPIIFNYISFGMHSRVESCIQNLLNQKPVEMSGYELFFLSPSDDGKKTLMVFLTSLDLKGNLPVWYSESAILSRAHSTLDNHRTLLGHLQSFVDKELKQLSNKTPEIILKDSENQKVITQEPTTTSIIPMKRRTQWPLDGMIRFKSGGLVFIDQATIQKQSGVAYEVLKSGSKSILEGKGIVGISLPVRIFEPISLIEKLAYIWGYAPLFLSLAAQQTSPLERLKYIVTFAISSLHLACFTRKPFNPILGETYQGHWEDGSQIYIEHTSHHPPISHYLVEGPNKIYKFWGFYEFKGQLKGNYGYTMHEGPNILETPDGNRVEWQMPIAKMAGIFWGQRIYEWIGNCEFIDKTNNLKCNLKLAYDSKPIMGKARAPSEAFRGEIMYENDVICKVAGSWLDGIEFDGKRYWSFYDYEPLTPQKEAVCYLPSDCRFREDTFYLKIGQENESQKWKLSLEAKQRKERQLRHDGRKIIGLSDPYCT